MDIDSIKGRTVVSIGSGAKLGSVDDFLFDIHGQRLAAMHIKADAQHGIIPFDQIRAIGGDAITVSSDDVVQWGNSGQALADLPDLKDVKKLKVVDEAGTLLGTVQHVAVTPEDGRISEITIHKGGILGVGGDTHIIPGGSIRSIGDEVIVVTAQEMMR